MNAPIVLFVYNRPEHTKKTIESLTKNELATQSDLIIFSDGPRNDDEKIKVSEVRNVISKTSGFKSVKLILSETNKGLASSIISGVTNTINKFGNIIVLEDDMIVSPYFLNFMNEGLELYENEEKVISIHGYIYPVKKELPETFFLRGADCWGWATWKRGWDLFEGNSALLLKQIDSLNLKKEFDYQGAFNNYKMLKKQLDGKIDSWAIRWHATAFVKNRLTLYPGKSLVKNIGVDGLGTHVGSTKIYDTTIAEDKVHLEKIPVQVDLLSKKIVSEYFKSIKFQSRISGLKRKLGLKF